MKRATLAGVAIAVTIPASLATPEPAQVRGLNGWSVDPVFTVGETIDGYRPVGRLDGLGAWDCSDQLLVLVNHEIGVPLGYEYTLANGTVLRGGRISRFKIDKKTRQIVEAGLAYDAIYNRAGDIVESEFDLTYRGLHQLCSAVGVGVGQAGFVDDVFLAGEEFMGGTQFALDVWNRTIWACPAVGVGAWESSAPLVVPSINETHVALILGDDREAAPLYLYVGEKDNSRLAGFRQRNGLAKGELYMWVADDGSSRPSQFSGTGSRKTGSFQKVINFDPTRAGELQVGSGALLFDDLGYATQYFLDEQKEGIGAFQFSRPEDVHTNPYNGRQVVMSSTGSALFDDGSDLWGTTYVIDVFLSPDVIGLDRVPANLRISYDGDDVDKQDFGLRSPDNLVWAGDRYVYIQEDRAVLPFGAVSGEEVSIWQHHPLSGATARIAQIDRSAIPADQVDAFPGIIGYWESSGIIEVSKFFGARGGSLFLLGVQAHSLVGGAIGDPDVLTADPGSLESNLFSGGQLLFLENPDPRPHASSRRYGKVPLRSVLPRQGKSSQPRSSWWKRRGARKGINR